MNSITFKKKLDSDVIKLGSQVEPLIGKEVEITIKELISSEPKKKKWKLLESVDGRQIRLHQHSQLCKR